MHKRDAADRNYSVTDRHSLRKQKEKAEYPVISASFGSLLIFSFTNRWRMHLNAPTSGFAVTGIPLTSQHHHGGTDPVASAAMLALRVSLTEAIFLERPAKPSSTADRSHSLVRKSI